MKDTIKSKLGYSVLRLKNSEGTDKERLRMVKERNTPLYIAELTDYETYLYNRDSNECFELLEIFTTIKGNQFIFWADYETQETFLTKIAKR